MVFENQRVNKLTLCETNGIYVGEKIIVNDLIKLFLQL